MMNDLISCVSQEAFIKRCLEWLVEVYKGRTTVAADKRFSAVISKHPEAAEQVSLDDFGYYACLVREPYAFPQI